MSRSLKLAVLALTFFSFSALPQQTPSTGSIEGIVVRADTEQPIANAQVLLTQLPSSVVGALDAIPPVITDADGKFVFKNLKPADYRVAATANGFVRQEYGQRTLNGQGRLLFVAIGQSINDANIRMTQAGTISGRILDETGQPATGTPVQLLRVFYGPQGKNYQPAGPASSTTADDRGNYRMFGVTPGRYYLMAGTPPAVMNLLPRGGLPTGGSRYSLSYYLNASNLDQATMIEVKTGEESSFDMRLKKANQLFHVRGRVINSSPGPFPADMMMFLGYSTFSSSGSANRPNSFDPATGAFDVASVPPGEFTVGIVQAPQTPRGANTEQQAQRAMGLAASVRVHVTDADIDGLILTLTPGITVAGKLIVEGQPMSAVPNLDQLRLTVRSSPLVTGLAMPPASVIAADGSFQVTGLREGEYRAQMSTSAPGFYVKSIKYGDEEIAGTVFKFSGSRAGSFEVVLKAGTPSISGRVTDSQSRPVSGVTVVFIPAQRSRVDLFRNTYTDQDGKFTMANLAQGDYKVFSWEAADNNTYFDPNFLEQYEQLGKTISVTGTSNSSVDVKLIPAQ
jgi:5-hydroxyisourate hydrolase-like protein (transthyretin family)